MYPPQIYRCSAYGSYAELPWDGLTCRTGAGKTLLGSGTTSCLYCYRSQGGGSKSEELKKILHGESFSNMLGVD